MVTVELKSKFSGKERERNGGGERRKKIMTLNLKLFRKRKVSKGY